MSQQLINRSPDLKKLWEEGYEIDVKGGYLLVQSIPYINSKKEIKYGTLVSALDMAGDKTVQPKTHVIHFIGDHPCNKDGSPISQIQNESRNQDLGNNIVINHSFSNKPAAGYPDYYQKITRYADIISAPAKSLDDSVTEKTFNIVEPEDVESVFMYVDTNSARAKIDNINSKLENQKIAIIGLGGTGSYVLDFLAKTPVMEIHLYDGDTFLQHNAFRSPGAPTIEKLRDRILKVDYLKENYSKMHKGIHAHPYFINTENVSELSAFNFVFICIDNGEVKKLIVSLLQAQSISFIDVGMGLHIVDNELIGIIRTTTGTPEITDKILEKGRIPFTDSHDNEYSTNIQIAELNALNAAFAVIKWKKILSFYQDLENEHFSTYTINTGETTNEDNLTPVCQVNT